MVFSRDIYARAYGLEFVWDITKEQKVSREHGVRFQDALSIFVDPYQTEGICNEPDANFALIGMGADKVLYVAFCYRNGNQYIRLTTVRKADATQKEQYEINTCRLLGIPYQKQRKKIVKS